METGGGGGATNGRGTNNLPSVFDICVPRKDIQDGIVESELAADLSRAVGGEGPPEYSDPKRFFVSTYPTRGIKDLLHSVLTRLKGGSSQAVFWLNTSFGGGKTHALIALLHAAKSPAPDTISEFADPSLLPEERVRIAIFDGQNADISNGHSVGGDIRARTPWGEIAYGLAGNDGYNRIDDDISGSPPGADTLKELIGDGPTLILLDEMAIYLRKAAMHAGAGKQFVAFLTVLIKAVESSPNAALVYTLAAGSSDDSNDAYQDENHTLMAELASVSARKTMLLNPTEEGETIQILRRRLFERRDEAQVDLVVDAYRRAWKANREKLSDVIELSKTVDEFKVGYPLHPDILNTLISKTSTLENFQRIRGMLRILGYVVHDLWKRRDKLKPTAIHLHHFDIGNESMRLEIASKLKQDRFAPAIDTDIACDDINKTSMAQRLDKKHYPDMPPFTTYVARVVFMNTLAFNQQLKGVDDRHLRYSVLWPGMELGYIDEALARFREESQYLDDNPNRPTQFSAIPNLSQAIQRAERSFEELDLEAEIDRRIQNMFQSGEFDLCRFPGGHEDVPDDAGKPKLVIPKYDCVTTSNPELAPGMVDDIFQYKGIGDGGFRGHRNNLVFLVAFEDGVDTMYEAARHHLAMSALAAPATMATFADYQQEAIKKKQKMSDDGLDDAILKCHKYLYYPVAGNRLEYTTVDWKKGGTATTGQRELIGKLRNAQKIRTSKDRPDLPESLVDRITGLKKDGEMTTQGFRNEFYRDTALPMLIGDDVFEAGIFLGIKQGVFVYTNGELICGKDDPACKIVIDDNSMVYTAKRASKLGIWPRKPVDEGTDDESNGGSEDGGSDDDDSKEGPRGLEPVFDPSSIRVTDKPDRAVTRMLDELQKHDVGRITKIQIESRDDIFPLLSVIGRIREFEVRADIEGDYSVDTKGGVFRFEYEGALRDSEPVQEFLKSQLREASVANISTVLYVKFKDDINIDWLETFAGRLRLVENDVTISGIERASE